MNFRKVVLLSLVLVSCTAAPAAQPASGFLGKWDISGTAPHSDYVYWLEVKEDGGKLSGMFLNRWGSVSPLPELTLQGDELVFAVDKDRKQVHRARLADGKLHGTLQTDKETVHWLGVRPPIWPACDANAPHKLGKAVELFDGKNLENWDLQNKSKPSGWSVADGVMTNSKGANNLISKEKFKDFRIRAEYKLESKSNSGIYLRGRYELQVLDDAGKEPGSHGHMAIYSRVKPSVNASRPAGEWQTMEATIVGNRVTVILNGTRVHDNELIEGLTGGALDSDEGSAGPILLQGDHGRVWFRKVTVTPIIS
jgi:hypothetical protein